MTFNQILQQIQQKKFAPIYYLHGAESYFIDKIVEALDQDGAVLTAAEGSFNRSLYYGPDTQARQLINDCRSFPVMANYRLIILKEAHRFPKKELDQLVNYLKQPIPSSILVMAFKDARAGLPKAAVSSVQKHGVDFHAKKLYEKDIQQWVQGHIRDAGFEADQGIAAILTTNLGTNIPLIENELEKMFIYLRATGQNKLNQNFVYEMINVDKKFNVFELVHALSERNVPRSHMIMDRLTQNTRINPPVLTLNGLFRFFHNLALVHRHKLRDPNSIKHQLKVNYFQARDYAAASRQFSLGHTYRNIGFIQEADLKLKGQISTQMDDRHVLKTLVWQLLS